MYSCLYQMSLIINDLLVGAHTLIIVLVVANVLSSCTIVELIRHMEVHTPDQM